jgi:hypothetical protein
MKNGLAFSLGLLLVLVAVAAFAGDGNVPQANLASLGLSGMQTASDAQGMQVRGMSSSAQATSLGFASMFLYDPNTGSSFVGGVNAFGRAADENAGSNAASSATLTLAPTGIAPFDHTITFNAITFHAVSPLGFGFSGGAFATSP